MAFVRARYGNVPVRLGRLAPPSAAGDGTVVRSASVVGHVAAPGLYGTSMREVLPLSVHSVSRLSVPWAELLTCYDDATVRGVVSRHLQAAVRRLHYRSMPGVATALNGATVHVQTTQGSTLLVKLKVLHLSTAPAAIVIVLPAKAATPTGSGACPRTPRTRPSARPAPAQGTARAHVQVCP